MDEFRFSKGIARWTSDFTPSAEEDVSDPDTKLLLRFDQAENHKIKYSSSGDLLGVKLQGVPDGIDGSRDFIESVNKGYSITNYGNVQIDTDKAKFGKASALFDGSGDYLASPSSPDFDLGTSDFTIETWLNLASLNTYQISAEKFTGSQSGYTFYVDPAGELTFYFDGNNYSTVKKLAPGSWYHVAAVRKGSTFRLYIDGNQEATMTTTAAISNQSSDFRIGSRNGSGIWLNGSMDEFRFSKGIARWTEDHFDVPTGEYTTDSYTKLLLHFDDGVDGSQDFVDSSNGDRLIPPYGDAQLDIDQAKFGKASARFDGSGDYLSVPSSREDVSFGTEDFTTDFWFQRDPNSSDASIWRVLLDASVYAGGGWQIAYDKASNQFRINTGESTANPYHYITSQNLNKGEWYHLAWARSAQTSKIYLNGTQIDSFTDTFNYQPTRDLEIGDWLHTYNSGHYEYWHGAIDEVRISKGIARWTGDHFDVPTGEHTTDAYTKLLLHFETKDQSYYTYTQGPTDQRFV